MSEIEVCIPVYRQITILGGYIMIGYNNCNLGVLHFQTTPVQHSSTGVTFPCVRVPGLLKNQLHEKRNAVIRSIRLRDEIYDLVRPWGHMGPWDAQNVDDDGPFQTFQGLEIPAVSRIFRPRQRLRNGYVPRIFKKTRLKIHPFLEPSLQRSVC